jgi:hypothetical protein
MPDRDKLIGSSLLVLLLSAAAAAAQGSGVRLELNRLEPQGENCRTYLLVENMDGTALRSLKLDLFALDTDGIAAKRLAVELGPVPPKKTLIKLFDFAALDCARVGRVLLNGVISCEDGAGAREDCLERINVMSKAPAVALVK